ncbi:MAG: hypothetical protein FWC34_09275 [Bacteroidetes bacterium]|nr:hypothetical protein [Bacteroidota bacterium]MCL2303010.1 hypothetical protein [Lentimicrobiaceae bacterium]
MDGNETFSITFSRQDVDWGRGAIKNYRISGIMNVSACLTANPKQRFFSITLKKHYASQTKIQEAQQS